MYAFRGFNKLCSLPENFRHNSIYLEVQDETVNYLDDFFFAAFLKALCDQKLDVFIEICNDIQFPVSIEKTFSGTTQLTFLRLLIDTIKQLICIPAEKINKALEFIEYFLDKKHRKVTVLQVQQLCGFLNFLCKCIIPGRVFLTRLYALTNGKTMKPHYHVRVMNENHLDLQVWKTFLLTPDIYCRPFIDVLELQATEINMFSDASGKISFSAICNNSWMFGKWSTKFLSYEPSIEYQELFALVAGVKQWIGRFRNKRVCLFCDNIAVVHMVNNNSAKCKHCMVLLRVFVMECLRKNMKVPAKYVRTKDNGIADSLSRLDFDRFRKIAPHMEELPTEPPCDMWPAQRLWKNL